MGEKQKLRENARQFRMMFGQLLDDADEIGKLGDIEQAQAEAQKRLAGLRASEQAAKASIAEATAAAAEIKAAADKDARSLVATANVRSSEIAANAEAQRQALLDRTSADTAAISATARAEATQLQRTIAERKSELDQVAAGITEARGVLTGLQAAVKDQTASFNALKQRHDEFKKKILADASG